MQDFTLPVALGPGAQPSTDSLDYLSMPQDMRTYRTPVLPEPEEARDCNAARALLGRLQAAAEHWQPAGGALALDLADLPAPDRLLLDQIFGEGEVSARVTGDDGVLSIQESVFAGIWRVRAAGASPGAETERIEVGDVPAAVRRAARPTTDGNGAARLDRPAPGPGVINAPALLVEIEAAIEARNQSSRGAQSPAPAAEPHVINLSLLPFTPEDGTWLDQCLGRGAVTMLSRGYGNCRITATGLDEVWWVQYFNSQDALILNTIEVTEVPEAACAALEDLRDSAERLGEVLDWIG